MTGIMQKRQIATYSLFAVLLIAVGLNTYSTAYDAGFKAGQDKPKTIIVKGLSDLETAKPEEVDFGTFWQAWALIDEEYLKADDVGSQERVYGAIKGLLGSLNDPYSDFFSPQENQKFQEDIRGSFGGIGAEIGFRDGQLVIIAPLKDTPASRAGLEAGDKILKIDEKITDGLSVDRAVRLIRGAKGTVVTLTILREGWDEPKEIKITRDTITVPTLDLEIEDGGIANLKLHAFNANTPYLMSRAAATMINAGVKGIVLDLRGNPGGYLDTAVEFAEWFLPKDTLVVRQEGRGGVQLGELKTRRNGQFKDIPLVVLVNKASASASEIVAGALRDERGVKIVGEKSFGKGTVQDLRNLKDNSSVKLTIANWVLPKGDIIEGKGLTPDYEISISEEDVKNGKDPQFNKALEILKTEISHFANR